MHFSWSTLALQTINFAILVWLLNRFLYKPVLRVMDARRAEIEKLYAAARDAETKAKAKLADLEAQRAAIADERAAALKSAAEEAEKMKQARLAQAEREAQALLDNARKTLAEERDRALSDLRRRALDLAAEMAGRLLAETPPALREQAWLDRIEQKLAALPKSERDSLVGQLTDGHIVTVATAEALPPEMEERWRKTINAALGDRADIVFQTEPELMAGAELHFPNAVLRFSWKSVLASIVVDTGAHVDAR